MAIISQPMNEFPASRKEAISLGLRKYFSGKSCSRGHITARYVSGGCVECVNARSAAWADKNPEKARAKDARWRERNLDKVQSKSAARYEGLRRDETLARDRARHEQDKPKRLASLRKWRESNRAAASAASRAWYARHREKILEQVRQWRIENPAEYRAAQRRYAEKHPARTKEVSRLASQKRRAIRRGLSEHCTVEELGALKARQKGRCAYCQERRRLTVDHVIPLARGGSDLIRNIQFVCQPCNSKKNAKDPIEFAQSIGLLL